MNQSQFGKALGVSQSAISGWEKGHVRPKPPILLLLSKLTGDTTYMSIRTLFGEAKLTPPVVKLPEPLEPITVTSLIRLVRRLRDDLYVVYDPTEDNKRNPIMQSIGNSIAAADRLLLKTKKNRSRELKEEEDVA